MTLDLMEIQIAETGKLDLTDGPETIDRHADGHADNAGFREGSVQ